MRTKLYVFKPTKVTIQVLNSRDNHATLTVENLNTPSRNATGSFDLASGVYVIMSQSKLGITGRDIHVESSIEDKEIWSTHHHICSDNDRITTSLQDRNKALNLTTNIVSLDTNIAHEPARQFLQIARIDI